MVTVWFIIGLAAGIAAYLILGVVATTWTAGAALRRGGDQRGLRAGVGLVEFSDAEQDPIVRRQVRIVPSK